MKRYIKNNSNLATHEVLVSAYNAMVHLLDIIDGMDEATYSQFQSHVSKNFYTELADGIQDLNPALK